MRKTQDVSIYSFSGVAVPLLTKLVSASKQHNEQIRGKYLQTKLFDVKWHSYKGKVETVDSDLL